jgi:hypothetical protein
MALLDGFVDPQASVFFSGMLNVQRYAALMVGARAQSQTRARAHPHTHMCMCASALACTPAPIPGACAIMPQTAYQARYI